MKIYCISEGSIYRIDSGKPQQLTCGRIKDYLHAVNEMKKRDEWKTTGKGAQFMQVQEKYYETEGEFLRSLSSDGERLIYGTFIDGVGGLYFKDPETDDETYIFANQTIDPGRVSFRNGKYIFDAGDAKPVLNHENEDYRLVSFDEMQSLNLVDKTIDVVRELMKMA